MRKFLTIFFVMLLLVPTAVRIMDLDLGLNINRLGLKFPQPYGQAFLEKEFYRAFDQYFNDSFPLRGPLILAKNWIDFNIFRTTEAEEVHIGRLGWLYSRKSITDYRRTEDAADADMERLVLQLHAIEKIVSAAERHFLFVVAPSKAAIYPEFVGWSPGFITGGYSAFDRLREHLDRYPLKGHVRLDQVMNDAKRRQALLYDRTHAYWNGLGASVAAESIHSRIRDHMASPVILDYVSTTDARVGDLSARIMDFESHMPEIPYQRLSGSDQPDLPSALLYGDGYQHNLIPYLLQMFKEIDVIQADRIPSIQHRENWLDYDCILLEIAQTGLRDLHIDLDRIYGVLGTRSRFFRRTALDLKSAVPLSRTSLRQLSDGVEIKSLGAGSAFDLTDVPGSNRDVFRVVKLTLASRQSNRMRFQYAFPLREAAVKSIRPGNMDFYLPLPFQKTVSLRIFPGDKAGLIHLRSAEMIEFSDPPEPDIQPLNELTIAKPSPAGMKPASPSLNDNATETGDEPDQNRVAVVTGWPDDKPPMDPRSELSVEPEHRPAPGPIAGSRGRLSHTPEYRPKNRPVEEANTDVVSRDEGQRNHLLIVDAEIELTHEPEARPVQHDTEDADSVISERAETLPEYDRAEPAKPEFSNEAALLPDHEPMPEGEPILPDVSEDLAYIDTVADTGRDHSRLPEMVPDRDPAAETDFDFRPEPEILPAYEPDPSGRSDSSNHPEFPSEDSPAADGKLEFSNPYESPADPDLLANLDPNLSNEPQILPVHDPDPDGESPPNVDQRQPDAIAADTNDNGSQSVKSGAAAEIEKPATAPEPGDGPPQATDARPTSRVNPNIPAKVESAAADPPSITLTDFEDGRIFQRRNRRADIVVSGTFTGRAGAIEARVVGADDLEEVQTWTVIDDLPRNGIFVGVLPGVPEGGWYHLQVRFGSDTTVSDAGSHRWGVGMLVACLGQSNMKEWFHTGDSFQAHALIRKYSDSGWSEPGTEGNGAIAFGNRLVKHLGIPVGLLDYAVNGSGLRKEADWGTGYWQDTSPGSIYSRFVAGVSGIGGAVEFVIWFQGEADAARKTVTKKEYRNSLAGFIRNQIRVDITNASDREHLPFLIIMMTRRPRGYDEPHQAIRNAQKLVAENEAECYLAATTLDLKNRGKQHMHPGAYTTMGYRVAQTVLYILGAENYYRGPTATVARKVNDRRIDVSIEHRGGRDFKPASQISGWEILVNEESRSIAEVKRRNSATISIILEDPLTETATLRYLYGAMPDARNPVVDNSPLALPLEPYQARVP